jgi:hypothetical protein
MSDDNVSVEVYFADKTLEEALDVLHKFLVASGYSVESGTKLGFVETRAQDTPVTPQEFTARA